tara:strand:+ start:2833 stop:4017 length:1185 start_codon:yes stop_codon:yes gene_type:complete
MSTLTDAALHYHKHPRPGKLATELPKPMESSEDLALAYSPGVAEPVKAIMQDPEAAYQFTGKGNLVGVISNGSAILGLGNQGPLAAKPVMEGKAALFKKFADIDAFDIEIDAKQPEEMIQIIQALAPTFGGINLEDIKAPECFLVEQTLQERLNIPIFHDDQHGTAITIGAALLNALIIQEKKLNTIKIVVYGAGASALASGHFLHALGLDLSQITFLDSRGVIHDERTDLNPYKQAFAKKTTHRTLNDALHGADVLICLAGAPIDNPSSALPLMADRPVIFTLSNPTPEIEPTLIKTLRPNAIIATGLSNLNNQVNNVVCFPYIFRGALDARATHISTDMMIAAAYAIQSIAQQPSLDTSLVFGPEYILPKPNDPRLREIVPQAVQKAYEDSL